VEKSRSFYGIKGNVSEDPVVIMKMMLLLFLDNVRGERELMRIIPERLDYMWFLGYGLDDTIPNLEQSKEAMGSAGVRVAL
jgi:transposase